MENMLDEHNKRNAFLYEHVVHELVATERSYVADMELLIRVKKIRPPLAQKLRF